MKRVNSEPLSDVLYRYLREQGLEVPLNEYRLIKAWNSVMGVTVSRYTSDLKIYNQVLFVTMKSAALKNEIMMRRTELTRKLNDYVGAQVVTGIVVR